MEAPLHKVGETMAKEGTTGIVVNIGYHCLAVTGVETDGVVVVVVEEGLLLSAHKSIVLLSLFL
jgi:hypothetical protein